MFPADAAGITTHVFPTVAVGIQVKYCSVHMLPLLRWEYMQIHNTNPAAAAAAAAAAAPETAPAAAAAAPAAGAAVEEAAEGPPWAPIGKD